MDAFLKTLQTLPEVAELVSRVETADALLSSPAPSQYSGPASARRWPPEPDGPWCFSVPTSGRPVNWRVICKV